MPIAIRARQGLNKQGLSRRQLLVRSAATCAVAGLGSLARPYLSRAADRPLITSGIQSGDVSADSAVIWARADRPARMQVECSVVESFKTIIRKADRRRIAGQRFHRKGAARRPAVRAGHFLSRTLRRHQRERHRRRGAGRAFPHRADRANIGVVRLVGRHHGPGLGHRRKPWRDADLPHHARQPSGLLHPFRRPHLCGLPGRAGIEAARWRGLAKHRHRGKIRRRPQPRPSSAATTNTTGSTKAFAPSTPPCPCSRNGTIMR